jgi:MFS family permease
MSALNSNTVGASLVDYLGGPAWAVAFITLAQPIGFALGPILSANRLDRTDRFLPALRAYLPWSRLPLLATAVVLWFSGKGPLSLWTVLVASTVYGIIAGMSVGAWQQLVAKTVAPEKRSSLFAIRYMASNLIGIGASGVVAWALFQWPGSQGYALLYLVGFAGTVLSYSALISIREKPEPPPPHIHHPFFANIRAGMEVFRADARLRWFLLSCVLFGSQFLMAGFLALHARAVLGKGAGYVGILTSAQMIGAVAGTLFAAVAGNRISSRAYLILSRVLMLSVAAGSIWVRSDWAFRILFACYGASIWINVVGQNTLTLSLLPASRRSTVLAVFSLVQVPCMMAASQVGAWLWHVRAPFAWIAGLSALGLAGALAAIFRVPQAGSRREDAPGNPIPRGNGIWPGSRIWIRGARRARPKRFATTRSPAGE